MSRRSGILSTLTIFEQAALSAYYSVRVPSLKVGQEYVEAKNRIASRHKPGQPDIRTQEWKFEHAVTGRTTNRRDPIMAQRDVSFADCTQQQYQEVIADVRAKYPETDELDDKIEYELRTFYKDDELIKYHLFLVEQQGFRTSTITRRSPLSEPADCDEEQRVPQEHETVERLQSMSNQLDPNLALSNVKSKYRALLSTHKPSKDSAARAREPSTASDFVPRPRNSTGFRGTIEDETENETSEEEPEEADPENPHYSRRAIFVTDDAGYVRFQLPVVPEGQQKTLAAALQAAGILDEAGHLCDLEPVPLGQQNSTSHDEGDEPDESTRNPFSLGSSALAGPSDGTSQPCVFCQMGTCRVHASTAAPSTDNTRRSSGMANLYQNQPTVPATSQNQPVASSAPNQYPMASLTSGTSITTQAPTRGSSTAAINPALQSVYSNWANRNPQSGTSRPPSRPPVPQSTVPPAIVATNTGVPATAPSRPPAQPRLSQPVPAASQPVPPVSQPIPPVSQPYVPVQPARPLVPATQPSQPQPPHQPAQPMQALSLTNAFQCFLTLMSQMQDNGTADQSSTVPAQQVFPSVQPPPVPQVPPPALGPFTQPPPQSTVPYQQPYVPPPQTLPQTVPAPAVTQNLTSQPVPQTTGVDYASFLGPTEPVPTQGRTTRSSNQMVRPRSAFDRRPNRTMYGPGNAPADDDIYSEYELLGSQNTNNNNVNTSTTSNNHDGTRRYAPNARVPPYKSGDFNQWLPTLLVAAQANQWDEDQIKAQLYSLCEGPARTILNSQPYHSWSVHDMVKLLRHRLGKRLSIAQVSNELEGVVMKSGENVADLMCRIDAIACKADPLIGQDLLRAKKQDAFMRAIRVNQPMYYDVYNSIIRSDDPDKVLELATEYERQQGITRPWVQKQIDDELTRRGFMPDASTKSPSSVNTCQDNQVPDDADVPQDDPNFAQEAEPNQDGSVNLAILDTTKAPDDWWKVIAQRFNDLERDKQREEANSNAKRNQQQFFDNKNQQGNRPFQGASFTPKPYSNNRPWRPNNPGTTNNQGQQNRPWSNQNRQGSNQGGSNQNPQRQNQDQNRRPNQYQNRSNYRNQGQGQSNNTTDEEVDRDQLREQFFNYLAGQRFVDENLRQGTVGTEPEPCNTEPEATAPGTEPAAAQQAAQSWPAPEPVPYTGTQSSE